MQSALSPSAARTTSSVAITMRQSEQPSYTHSSAAVKPTMLTYGHGWSTLSKESQLKKTLISYYLATGRYYQLIASNNKLLPTTSRHYPVLPSNGGKLLSIRTWSHAYLSIRTWSDAYKQANPQD